MKNTISVRHCEVPEDLRSRADAVMERIARHSTHALGGAVVFDQSSLIATVELRVHVRGGQILVGIGEGPDHRTALDRAEGKLRRQLDRWSDQVLQNRRSSPRA